MIGRLSAIAAAASAVLLSGCFAASVHPLYLPEEHKTVAALEGEWEAMDNSGSFFNFHNMPGDDPARDYILLSMAGPEGSPTRFVARGCILSERQFLDLQPVAGFDAPVPADIPHLLLYCAPAGGSGWRLHILDTDKLWGYLKAHPAALQYDADVEDGELRSLTLTGPTEELRGFFGSDAALQLFSEGVVINYTGDGGPDPESGPGTTG